MRRIGLFLTILLLTTNVMAHEETSLLGGIAEKIPPLKQGVAYSMVDSKINYLSTIEILKKKGFTLEAGYAGDADSSDHKIVGVLSYELLKLRDLGVDLPILDLVEFNPGIYFGAGRLNFKEMDESETDWGVSMTCIRIKW